MGEKEYDRANTVGIIPFEGADPIPVEITNMKFWQLEDTPNDYAGYAGKGLKVKSTEDGLEFTDMAPDAHASRHQPGGADALPTATPGNITEGATASEGTSTSFARADHVHGTPSEWTPKAHASTHEEGGSDAINPSNIGANWDKLVNKPSTFPPSSHASSHQVGGSDVIDVRGLQGGWLTADLEANRPEAGTKDRYFYATDTGKLYYDNGTSWVEITPTPAEHGNEAHNPDMLPLSTSNAINAYMSGNKWLSVATSGIVGLPKQSRCRAYLSGSDQSVPTDTWTKVQLNAVLYDEQGEFDPDTYYRFTATEAGYYTVAGAARIADLADQKLFAVAIYKNGSRIVSTHCYASGTSYLTIPVADVVYLDVGDYLDLVVYRNHGSNRSIKTGFNYTYMAVHKLS